MKGSLWAVFASVAVAVILFSGADVASTNNTTNASTAVRDAVGATTEPVGILIYALIIGTVAAIALTAGGEF